MRNKEWLETTIVFEKYENVLDTSLRGRPQTGFIQSSERTKRRRTESLRKDNTVKELSYAAHMSLRSSGEVEAAKVVRDVTCTTPKRASKYRKAYVEANTHQEKKPLSTDKALSMIIEAKLTKH